MPTFVFLKEQVSHSVECKSKMNTAFCRIVVMWRLVHHCMMWISFLSSTSSAGFNLALNRPANQSSTTYYSANLAVDGNYDNSHAAGFFSCAHNNDLAGGPNWLVVDLGREYSVQSVVLTNRIDCCASRLDYFIVGVTNSFSQSNPPVRDSYPLCGQYPGTAAAGAKLTLNCSSSTPPGQFVIIQQPVNGPGFLTICELEVYGYASKVNQWLGCYQDISIEFSILNQTSLTIQWCVDRCGDQNSTFAALRNGVSCFCTDDVRSSTSDETCHSTCSGNTNQYCGSLLNYAVYTVCPVGYYGRNCGSVCQCGMGQPCTFQTGICFSGCSEETSESTCNLFNCTGSNGTCGRNAICERVDLKFTSVEKCECSKGFHRIQFWSPCTDINECVNSSVCNISSEICVNTDGGFSCVCFNGYHSIDNNRPYSCQENSKTAVAVATNSTPNATNSSDNGNCDEHVSTSTIVLAVLLGVFVLATLTLAIDDFRLRLRNHSDSTLSPSFLSSTIVNTNVKATQGDANLYESADRNYDNIASTKEGEEQYESISADSREHNKYTTLSNRKTIMAP